MRKCIGCGKVIVGRGKKFCSELCRFKFGADGHESKRGDGTQFNHTQQLCWSCANACNGNCSWSRELKPVEGWDAESINIKWGNGENANSYRILNCPKYRKETRGEWLD